MYQQPVSFLGWKQVLAPPVETERKAFEWETISFLHHCKARQYRKADDETDAQIYLHVMKKPGLGVRRLLSETTGSGPGNV